MKVYVPCRIEGRDIVRFGNFSSKEKAMAYAFKITHDADLAYHRRHYPDEEYEYNSADLWDGVGDDFYFFEVDTDYVDRD
tara:strand:- start:372 stop:611 length:240 start_codon:yes stop_codon:yes gene_type:complete